ncbi:MAG TPA: SEC-C metal-binding domain-containing protein [Pseudogracilibacillus sp.]|nr:SEC-C metal-binding domain-containing protein [Pseudogracilibacillus sp.]
MKKPGRNDPCSCGSGKKYRKCCGKSNVIPFKRIDHNHELKKLHDDLFLFAIGNYKEEIDVAMDEYVQINNVFGEKVDVDTYVNLLVAWIIYNEPIIGDNTAFELFYEQNKDSVKNKKVQQVFSSWERAISSVFQIKDMTPNNKELLLVEDLLSGDMYEIEYKNHGCNEWDYLIGTIVPFMDFYKFTYVITNIKTEYEPIINEIISQYDLDFCPITDLYPILLADLINPDDDDELEWLNYQHAKVAELFAYHMDKKGLDEELIYVGLLFWNNYCLKHHPYVKKESTYVAALDYFVNKQLVEGANKVSQSELAKEYDVAPATISNYYRRFVDELHN